MKLQQLRYLVQVAKSGLNVSDAAEALHTSQPGISKQIRLLEDELGVEIFVRHGKRVIEITEPGRTILDIAQRVLKEADNLKQAGKEFASETTGSLTIATTHTQARYALPQVIKRFVATYPEVRLSLHQGSPIQIAQAVVNGEADLVIATEGISQFEELVMLPCYQWNR
jgi:LysR family cys regulon transcriptional activator